MTNRDLAFIVKDQNPLTLTASQTVRLACQRMVKRGVGAVLVVEGVVKEKLENGLVRLDLTATSEGTRVLGQARADVQALADDLPDTLRAILHDTGVDARLLELEITESALMQHSEATATTLAELSASARSRAKRAAPIAPQ